MSLNQTVHSVCTYLKVYYVIFFLIIILTVMLLVYKIYLIIKIYRIFLYNQLSTYTLIFCHSHNDEDW